MTRGGLAALGRSTTSRIALNPFVESFNGRSRDELLNVEEWVVGQFHVEK